MHCQCHSAAAKHNLMLALYYNSFILPTGNEHDWYRSDAQSQSGRGYRTGSVQGITRKDRRRTYGKLSAQQDNKGLRGGASRHRIRNILNVWLHGFEEASEPSKGFQTLEEYIEERSPAAIISAPDRDLLFVYQTFIQFKIDTIQPLGSIRNVLPVMISSEGTWSH